MTYFRTFFKRLTGFALCIH